MQDKILWMPFGLLNYINCHPLDIALMLSRVIKHSAVKCVSSTHIDT